MSLIEAHILRLLIHEGASKSGIREKFNVTILQTARQYKKSRVYI